MAKAQATKKTVAEFDREIAVEEMILAGDAAASLASRLYQVGAMDESEFSQIRTRAKEAAEVPSTLPTKMIRDQAKTYRQIVADFEERYVVAVNIQEREAALLEKPARKTKARSR